MNFKIAQCLRSPPPLWALPLLVQLQGSPSLTVVRWCVLMSPLVCSQLSQNAPTVMLTRLIYSYRHRCLFAMQFQFEFPGDCLIRQPFWMVSRNGWRSSIFKFLFDVWSQGKYLFSLQLLNFVLTFDQRGKIFAILSSGQQWFLNDKKFSIKKV